MATYKYGTYQSWTTIGVKFRAWFAYTISSTDTTYSITVFAGPQLSGNTGTVGCSLTCKLTGTGQTTRSTTKTFSTNNDDSSKRMTFLSSKTWTWNKQTSPQTVTIKASISRSNMNTSTASKEFTIPALTITPPTTYSTTVKYYVNGGSGAIADQIIAGGEEEVLSTGEGFTRDGYGLVKWNTASDGSGTSYNLGATYTAASSSNATLNLYAQWSNQYAVSNILMYRTDDVVSGDTVVGTPEQQLRGSNIYISFSYQIPSNSTVSGTIVIDDNTEKSFSVTNTTGTFKWIGEEYSIFDDHLISIVLGNITFTQTFLASITAIDCLGLGTENVCIGIRTPAIKNQPLTLWPEIYIGGNLLVDYIIDSDTIKADDDSWYWHYDKWASGKVEAWGKVTTGTLTMSASGNLYRVTDFSVSIPKGIFDNTPTSTQVFTEHSNSYTVAVSGNATSTTSISCQIWKSTNSTTSINLRFHVCYHPDDETD